jgi:hypothetical protein
VRFLALRDFYFSRDFLLGIDTVQEAERAWSGDRTEEAPTG